MGRDDERMIIVKHFPPELNCIFPLSTEPLKPIELMREPVS